MIPVAFDYARPESVAEAIALLADHPGEAHPLAGGQSLVPLLRARTLTPHLLVDLRMLPGLDEISAPTGNVQVGALVTHHDLAASPALAPLPMFADAGQRIGDVQVRNRGTFAGSLAHADPAGDWAPVALAADAVLDIASPTGPRTAPITEFFRAPYTSCLRPGELITCVRIPIDSDRPRGSAYVKFADGASGAAITGVAVLITVDGDKITEARVAVTGVAATPLRIPAAEATLVGRSVKPGVIAEAVTATRDTVEVTADGAVDADYRRQLVTVACRRALTAAAGRLPSAPQSA